MNIKKINDIPNTEEGILLKVALRVIKGFRDFTFESTDTQEDILQQLITTYKNEQKNVKQKQLL